MNKKHEEDGKLISEFLVTGRRGLPAECIKETFEALRPIYLKYIKMEKRHMSRDRIIGLMGSAFRMSFAEAPRKGEK